VTEETSKKVRPRKAARCDYNNNSDADDEPECNNDSDAKDDAKSDNNILFDFKDDKSDNNTINEDINGQGCLNSGYNSDGTNVIITKDINKCYIIKLNKYK
jgi:hypothetical protein